MTWNLSLRVAGMLLLALLLFLPSLLTILPPGLNALWKLSIPVKEIGFFLTLPCLLLAFWTFFGGHARYATRTASILFAAAALLYGYPLVRALETAHRLERDFKNGFEILPASPAAILQRNAPLIWKDFVRGVPVQQTAATPPPTTLTYATKDGIELRLDFYGLPTHPADLPGNAPCIVVIHGGGWDTGERGQLPELNPWLVGAGYTVATIDYRLAPQYAYPAPVEDVADALGFLRAHAGELGIDSTRFVLLGRSAGGQIALQAAYTLKDPSIKGVIAYYAPADMVFGYSLPGNPLILDSRKVMDQYLGGGCIQHPENCRAASPLEFADANSPPTLLLHGKPDVLVSYKHTLHLEDKLDSLGVPHFSVKLPWATHGYDYMFSGLGSQISLYFIERFLARAVP